jgi:hypothetical protein
MLALRKGKENKYPNPWATGLAAQALKGNKIYKGSSFYRNSLPTALSTKFEKGNGKRK